MIGTLLTLEFTRKRKRKRKRKKDLKEKEKYLKGFVAWSSGLYSRGTCTLAESRATCETNKNQIFKKLSIYSKNAFEFRPEECLIFLLFDLIWCCVNEFVLKVIINGSQFQKLKKNIKKIEMQTCYPVVAMLQLHTSRHYVAIC